MPPKRDALQYLLSPQYYNNLLQALEWFGTMLTADNTVVPKEFDDAADRRVILICMTPRSGSTALSSALATTGQLGRGGELLNRNSDALKSVLETHKPANLRALLDLVIEGSRSKNGVAQIKCDLPQILPFLLDPDCAPVLMQARIVYLTREDLLGQAISRYRGFVSGTWHARQDRDTQFAEVPYDYEAITSQVHLITQMMATYERLFAGLNLSPLRITYEEVVTDPGTVMRKIGALVDVDPGELSLDDGKYRKVAAKNTDALRDQFLADCQTDLLRADKTLKPDAV
ncbi:hypothetical protein C1J03_19535 [Sulfitobacter sp. SK012]|uniref:Stf0 family sulfotransferase n=1 Tax=Sulfitobacter sp. SK012 TaxID=1389005 RepID=UPI000E09E2D1|nr:Stf0 family sulfotransferase [Sulfitobacter sp. SK012]AXI47999.1 hypothetical protein C1J03_19535 [Sulfitobacter sp. SK012]